MSSSVEQIKRDLNSMAVTDFYSQHFLHDYNWYFKNVLAIDESEHQNLNNELRTIITTCSVECEEVLIVGSAKIGCSLAPRKNYKEFNINNSATDPSDIDIAIISKKVFEDCWRSYRSSFKIQYKYIYNFIIREIYRGFINENNLTQISECRQKWDPWSNLIKKKLKSSFMFRHKISLRIYRNKTDLKEYTLNSIDKARRN